MIEYLHGEKCGARQWRSSILLIHGIDGDHHSTWSANPKTKPWYDEICKSLPGIAIYSARLPYSNRRTSGSYEKLIENHSRDLVNSVQTHRFLDRHLYIVCHSLGGILAKRFIADTLVNDPESYYRLRRINLRGIHFLGVPHHGSPWADLRTARALSVLGLRSETSKDLKPGSRILADINENFLSGIGHFNFCRIINFHETLPMSHPWYLRPLLNRLGPVVPRKYSELPAKNAVNIEVGACHVSLPKMSFPGSEEIIARIISEVRSSFSEGKDSLTELSI